MKIQFASDLHLEFLMRKHPKERLVKPHPDASVLVLAGDIHTATLTVDVFSDWPVPVIYIAGNHESYRSDLAAVHVGIRQRIADLGISDRFHFLENDSVTINGVRFLGATLWTDYELMQVVQPQTAAMHLANMCMMDHRVIRLNGADFLPGDALIQHQQSRAWLERELGKIVSGVHYNVVVTHHGCHPNSIHERFEGNRMNPAFVSNLEPLVKKADAWIHGHVHNSMRYRIGKCEVRANPAGYIGNLAAAKSPTEFDFENPEFDPTACIDLSPPTSEMI